MCPICEPFFLSGTVKEDKPSSPIPTQIETAATPPMEPQPTSMSSKLPSIIDDNSSFFSLNSFQKVAAPSHPEEQADAEHTDSEGTQPSAILTDTLPNINTTEDWAAAFGFHKHASDRLMEEIGLFRLCRYSNVVYDIFGFRYEAARGNERDAGHVSKRILFPGWG